MRPIKIRFVIVTIFLIVAVLALPLLGMVRILPAVLATAFMGLMANFLSLMWLRWGRGTRYRIHFATFVDFLLITIAIHYMGGIETTMVWVYAVALIAIATLHGARVGIFSAVISSLMYSSLLIGEYLGVIPHVDFHLLNPVYLHDDPSYLGQKLLSDNILFFLSAAVSGFLSGRLVRRRDESEKRNREILKMQATLREYSDSLEDKISERTSELSEANERLQKEVEDRKLAEEGLRNSHERLQILFEFAPDCYYLSDLQGRLIDGNRAAEELTGYDREELIGKGFLDLNLLSEDQREKAASGLDDSIQGKATGPHEFILKRKDGTHVSVEIRTFPVVIGNQSLVLGLARDITARKNMERALRMSEERYREIYDTAPLAFVAWDRDTIITDWNTRAEVVFGWSREEALGRDFFDFLIPEQAKPQEGGVVDALLRGDLPIHSINENMTKSGEVILCEWNNSIQRDSEGNVIGVISIALDITERRRAEEQLRASEEKYRTLLDSIEIGFYEVDLAGNLIFFNDTVCKSLGRSREELLGINFDSFVNERDAKGMFEAFNTVFKTGRSDKSFESDVVTKDGSIKHLEYSVSLVSDHDGRPMGFRGLVRDISERKRSKEAIEKSNSLLRATLEATGDGILVADGKGKISSFNERFVELWRIPPSVLESRDDEEALAFVVSQLKDPDGFLEKVAELYNHPDAESFDVLEFKDGRIFERYSKPQRVGGKSVGRVWSFRDITQHRQLEQQFFQAQKMESVGTLAGGIAHDFNNILGGILGYASLMKSKITSDHIFFKHIDTIEKGAMRAAELTAQLLAFARGGKYNTRTVGPNEIIGETLGIIGRTFAKSIEIETRLDDALPTVQADAGQIQQVLMNLFVNAADAMPDGGTLSIESGTETLSEQDARAHPDASAGDYVVISVADTGIGIEEETMHRIFEPFFTTKEEGKGTGLGLSMIYGVVKNHGGFVTVRSEVGEGSEFKVHLPAGREARPKSSTAVEEPRGGNELILVVDDEEPIRLFAKEALETHGYRVLAAADGTDAIDVFGENNGDISLVILDMVMPNMGGQETFLKLREMNPEVNALLSTGYSQDGQAQGILNSGVKGFIQKPYQVNALLSKVRKALDTEAGK